MEITTPSGQKMTVEAKVIRADGREENLGTVIGGSLFQRIASYLRIKLANARVKVELLINSTH